MKKKIFIMLTCTLMLCGCGKVPTLSNGEEAVVTFKKGENEFGISANELFNELKDKFGLEATIKLIDTMILEKEFSDNIDKAKTDADNYAKALIEAYGGEEELVNQIRQNTSYQTLDAYKEAIYLSYMTNHAVEEYAKIQIKDKDIEKYYDEKLENDIELYHILVTSKATDSMSDEEKTNEENKAKETINTIIEELNKSDKKFDKFKELVKEYSEDNATKDKDGNLGFINKDTLDSTYDELVDAAYKLKDGAYSTEVITTELGYHVIFRNSTAEKKSLDDARDTIIDRLSKELLQSDSTIGIKGIKYYRELYNLEIHDSELDRLYGIYMNNLLNANLQSK